MSLSKSCLLSACLVCSCSAMENPLEIVFNGSRVTTNSYVTIKSKQENNHYIITKVKSKRARPGINTHITLIIPSVVNGLQVKIAPKAFNKIKKSPRRAAVSINMKLTSVDDIHVQYPTDCSELFSGSTLITNIDMSGFNQNQVIEQTNKMFYGCTRLKGIKFGNFITDNVTDMSEMFKHCKVIKNLDLSCFNTSNVTNMKGMFAGCISLKDLNISLFNTSNVQSMEFMFSKCKNLKTLNLNNLDTSKVTSMKGMFLNCTNLQNLDLNSFNTSKVESMEMMFDGCKNLLTLDIGKFDTANVIDMSEMFKNCYSLSKISLDGFSVSESLRSVSNMFTNCRSLSVITMPPSFSPKSNNMIVDRIFCGCTNLCRIICPKEWDFDKYMEQTKYMNCCVNYLISAS